MEDIESNGASDWYERLSTKIKKILQQSGYPEEVIIYGIKKKILIFNHPSGSALKSVWFI